MQTITLSANSAFLEQVLEFAKNLAKKQNEKVQIRQECFPERYEKDIEAYLKGELKTRPFSEFEEEMKSW